jgi:SiaC family regulatory phosphoprotein
LDVAHGRCVVVGQSLPEDAADFYGRLVQWVEGHEPPAGVTVNWEFRLPYFNTSSTKGLYLLLKSLKAQQDRGRGIHIRWDVEDDDEFMREAGENFMELLDITMELRELTENSAQLETEKLDKELRSKAA